ncbi:MAG: hypothetical protein LBL34_01135 [Clostridiales bacterium]|nr:hypothetical protein [Clostridiales bacterium]
MMNKEKFTGLLSIIVPQIAKEYMARTGAEQEITLVKIYKSKMYEMLEDEETKMWHFSPKILCDILFDEIDGKDIQVPVEG